MSLGDLLIWSQFLSTWFMVGVIWFVQIVHYPLFNDVGRAEFSRYESQHQQRTTWVVMPPMLVELISAIGLLAVLPETTSALFAWANLISVLAIWALTFFWQVPQHSKLSKGFDGPTHKRLVRGNWSRTLLWSLRGLLVVLLIPSA